MQKIFNFIVNKRYLFLGLFIIVTGFSVALMGQVNINNDLSKYLPDDSQTKLGYEVLEDQFGVTSSLKVVFEGLSEAETQGAYVELSGIENIAAVEHDASAKYNVDDYTMFVIRVNYDSVSSEAKDVLLAVQDVYPDSIVGGEIYIDNQPLIPTYLIVLAFLILMTLLFIFTSSWIEPILFLITIGMAILINMGTNVLFDSVSMTTYSIAALLQLCLSIDYSIILLNRYRQEKNTDSNKYQAMKNALKHAFPSIAGSSLTTIVGLLCLLFMSFKIGSDMGLVLAKGVFISLLTVFFVLPAVIILFDKVIEKTSKWSLHLNVNRMSRFGYKTRIITPIIFVLLFIGSFFLRGSAEIGYILPPTTVDEASAIFPDENMIVILYDNDDEANIADTIATLQANQNILDISAYSTTIGQALSIAELSQVTGYDSATLSYMLGGIQAISLYDFFHMIQDNDAFTAMMTPEQITQLNQTVATMDAAYAQLVGPDYSRIILTTSYPVDSETTVAFIVDLQGKLDNDLLYSHYLMGNSVMANEISAGFDQEFLTITLITVIAIFLVVALTFKSIIIPTILVSIIQTAIFVTTGVLGFMGDSVYFLALMIVQAILMGATIDYGILFTSYFKENIKILPVKEALKKAYKGSTHTILTSASILFFVTGLLGIVATDPTITQVIRALAVGTLSSTLLVLFALPSILVLMRKLIIKA